ncbi:MAG: hypothetical protein LBV01_06335 [Deltaproteobacteria bacterium]|jgi:hypothetical protein|nr:hypothetical protein [Deltaproteobacteria bacterium]
MLTSTMLSIMPDASSLWDIQRHFLEGRLDLAPLKDVLIGLGCLAGALLLLTLIIYFRPRKPYVPQDWIMDPEVIRETLNQAIHQRGKFELQFAVEGEMRRPALRCGGLDIKGAGIIFEAAGLATLSTQWQGKQVDCFFMIRKREQYFFYAFSSTIETIKIIRDQCFITVLLPKQLETRQKRSYLRITPPEEYMLGAAVWRGPDMPENAVKDNLALWPKPSRIWLPGTREEFSIRDISSGGMRLHLPRHILAEEMDMIHVSSQFIAMLDLWDPDKAQRFRCWLFCRMQSPVLDFETKGMDLGAQFLAWAKPASSGGSSLLWLKLASSGEVEPLGNWIMRRHLEYFREADYSPGFAPREAV